MLCDFCKKHKASNYKKVFANGKNVFAHLCDGCSQIKQINNNEQKIAHEYKNANNKDYCPVCFSTLESIKQSGKMGCSNCYQVFCVEIEKYINSIQLSVSSKEVKNGK